MLSPKGALAKSGEGSNSSKSIRWGNVGTLPTGLSDTELLDHFTKRLPENQDTTLKKPLTLCEQLELLQSQTEIGHRLCDFMEAIPKPAERHQEVEVFMKTISKQKAALQSKKEGTVVHSRSAPALVPVERPTHVLSTLHGSASYTFGKPVHGKGKFKIPVVQVRDPEYGTKTERTPAAGEYNLRSVSFPEFEEPGGSQTGGWKYADHKAFMERLKIHRHKPTKGFFEHLYHEMPQISSVEIIDHVHWLADYTYHLAQKQWNLDNFIDEREQVEEDDLDEAFRPFGDLTSLHLPLDRSTGYAKGYCMLEFRKHEEALAALSAMNGGKLKGKPIEVSWLCKEETKPGRDRSRSPHKTAK